MVVTPLPSSSISVPTPGVTSIVASLSSWSTPPCPKKSASACPKVVLGNSNFQTLY